MPDNGETSSGPEEITHRPKWLFDGCDDIDDMIQRLDEKGEELEALKSEGYELVADDERTGYCVLRKGVSRDDPNQEDNQ